MAANQDGTVDIHGTAYTLIATRLKQFREDHATWSIKTKLLRDGEFVTFKATISDEDGRVISTGYAEEERGLGNINKTSAVENAETSAVGRALAFVSGEYAGNAIRSADEMANAISQQHSKELIEYNALVREFWPSINACKGYLEPKWGDNENQHHVTEARACMKELGDEIYKKLWRAPSKGGCFTTKERTLLKEPTEDCL